MTEEQKIKTDKRRRKAWEALTLFARGELAGFPHEARAEWRHIDRVIFDHATNHYYDTHRKLVRDIAGRTQ